MARDNSAELTSNDGFSVVAPMKVMRPCSTKGRKASCCALLKRWTSSTKRIVVAPRLLEIELRAFHRLADVLHAGKDGGERDELRVEGFGHEPRQRRLADAGRSPQDHRMRLARLERETKRLAGPKDMALPYDLVERARPQLFRERRGRFALAEEIIH